MVKEQTIDSVITEAIKQYDVAEAAVEQYKEKFLPLKINGIEDKEGYAEVAQALKLMVKRRNEIEAKRKELKEDSLKYGRAVDSEAKRLTALLAPIEEHLKAEKQRVDDELERIAKQAEMERLQKIQQRSNALYDLGAVMINDEFIFKNIFTNEEVTLHKLNLDTLNDADFTDYLNAFAAAKEAFDAEKSRREEEAENKAKLLREQEERIREAERKLQEQEQKLKEAEEAIQKQRLHNRISALINAGFVQRINGDFSRVYDGGYEVKIVSKDELGCDEQQWDFFITTSIPSRLGIANLDYERHLAELEEKRLQEEHQAEERVRLRMEQEQAAEQERINSLSDKEKLNAYCHKLLEVSCPQMATKKWAANLAQIRKYIHDNINE